MDVLVDYDNLETNLTRLGLWTLCLQLVSVIGLRRLQAPERCRIRLYGGWYDKNRFTRRAENLIADIAGAFPSPIIWNIKGEQFKCLTNVEMAYSLEADPGRHLFRTIRARNFDARIECDTVHFDACPEQWCPMNEVAEFLQKQKCPVDNCKVLQADVLWRWEQKLIDTMLASDLIFLASKGQHDIVVVSSDDDMWPGVRTALQFGGRVTIIQSSERRTPEEYTRGVERFEQIHL